MTTIGNSQGRQGAHAVSALRPAGMTLLEVLVACGVLLLGLSGIAALLAATSSLVNEAASLDQTATLIANAHAEIHNRQICSLQAFQSGTSLPGVRTACLGDFQQQIASISSIVSSTAFTSMPLMPATAYVSTRVDGPEVGAYRSFRSEDRLQYGTGSNGLPAAAIVGGTLAHDSLQRTCWGGLLTLVDCLDTPVPAVFSGTAVPHPASSPNSPNRFRGVPARLDVAIFKKPASDGANAVLLLTQTGGPCMFQLSGSADVQSAPSMDPASLSRTFLPGCSFVLALPPLISSMSGTLPQTGTSTSSSSSLAVLDRWDGATVTGFPFGLKLQGRFFASDSVVGSRLFYQVISVASGSTTFTQAQLVSIFGCATTLSDGPSARTKTVGPYTVRLPTAQEASTVLQSAPAARYWTSTCSGNSMLVYDKSKNKCEPPVSATESCCVALEVAVSPTWYRIQTSWPTITSTTSASGATPNPVPIFPVTTIITDPRVYEFPRDATSLKLRVAAFQGLMGVESTYLVVE